MADIDLNAYYKMINDQQMANNAWSAEQAKKAMVYQERMSNTAHQREVADLKKAGLNPVLSAGGSGASSGSGVAASAGDGNVTALYGLISKALDAAIAGSEASNNSAKGGSGSGGSGTEDDISLEDLLEKLSKDSATSAGAIAGVDKDKLSKLSIGNKILDASLNAAASVVSGLLPIFNKKDVRKVLDSAREDVLERDKQFVQDNPWSDPQYSKELIEKELNFLKDLFVGAAKQPGVLGNYGLFGYSGKSNRKRTK